MGPKLSGAERFAADKRFIAVHDRQNRRMRRCSPIETAQGASLWTNPDLCAGSGPLAQARDEADYLSRAGSRSNRPGRAWLAVSRTLMVALRDSGVTSGLTSMTAVPRDKASSASPAAG